VLKCRDVAELVTPYLEGALPLRIRLATRFHLWLCAACRAYVEQMRRTIDFLGSGPRSGSGAGLPSETPPELTENESKIMALLDAQKRGSGPRD
jgi:anti-sigma factor RsiW